MEKARILEELQETRNHIKRLTESLEKAKGDETLLLKYLQEAEEEEKKTRLKEINDEIAKLMKEKEELEKPIAVEEEEEDKITVDALKDSYKEVASLIKEELVNAMVRDYRITKEEALDDISKEMDLKNNDGYVDGYGFFDYGYKFIDGMIDAHGSMLSDETVEKAYEFMDLHYLFVCEYERISFPYWL